MRSKRNRAYILVLPSMLTTGNLFCGFFSLLRSFNHDFERAAYAIILAGIFDVLDGSVARLTRSTSNFGLEYDSIVDVVSFGIAPAVLAYIWALQSFGRLGWAAAFIFAACGALRLARFNTIVEATPKSYFVGLPIPAAANLIAAIVLAYHHHGWDYPDAIMLVLVFVLGLLMVSTVRYHSFKDFDLKHRRGFLPLVLFVLLLAFIATRPELTLLVVFGYYASSGLILEPVRLLSRRQLPNPSQESQNTLREEK